MRTRSTTLRISMAGAQDDYRDNSGRTPTSTVRYGSNGVDISRDSRRGGQRPVTTWRNVMTSVDPRSDGDGDQKMRSDLEHGTETVDNANKQELNAGMDLYDIRNMRHGPNRQTSVSHNLLININYYPLPPTNPNLIDF